MKRLIRKETKTKVNEQIIRREKIREMIGKEIKKIITKSKNEGEKKKETRNKDGKGERDEGGKNEV